jgi:hypothetical protein
VDTGARDEGLAGLIVDYGGVLTNSPSESFRAWLRAEGLPAEPFRTLMRDWLDDHAAGNPLHGLETGRLSTAEFERVLAERLRGQDAGHDRGVGRGEAARAAHRAAVQLVGRRLRAR